MPRKNDFEFIDYLGDLPSLEGVLGHEPGRLRHEPPAVEHGISPDQATYCKRDRLVGGARDGERIGRRTLPGRHPRSKIPQTRSACPAAPARAARTGPADSSPPSSYVSLGPNCVIRGSTFRALHLVPCTLHLVPCALHLAPCALCLVPSVSPCRWRACASGRWRTQRTWSAVSSGIFRRDTRTKKFESAAVRAVPPSALPAGVP